MEMGLKETSIIIKMKSIKLYIKKIFKIFLVFLCVILLFSMFVISINYIIYIIKPSFDDLIGEYVVNYEFGREELILYKDKTFKQTIEIYPGIYKISGEPYDCLHNGVKFIDIYKESDDLSETYELKEMESLVNNGTWEYDRYSNNYYSLSFVNYVDITCYSSGYNLNYPNIKPFPGGYCPKKKLNGKIKLYFNPDSGLTFDKVKDY